MKKTTGKGIMGYAVAAIIALFLIFFVGAKTEIGTGITKRILTANGLAHFKKGLDLAGGVRLTYKIDFSKTEALYAEQPAELLAVKKTAQDIILKNIDKRISALGVSDYNAFVQKLQDGEYLVVEIGGVQDMEAAKKLIGKTVELEFKVPNEKQDATEEVKAQRQKLAEEMFAAVSKDPTSMKNVGSTKGSQDVYYNNFDAVSLSELPAIYKSHINELTAIQNGSVYPGLLTGVYHMMMTQTESGIDTQILQGFTSIRYNGKKESHVDTPSQADVKEYAKKSKTEWKSDIARGDAKAQSLSYDAAKKTLTYYGEEILPAQDGYDLVIYQTMSGADIAAMTTALENGTDLGDKATQTIAGWQTADSLKQFIADFKDDTSKKVQVYDELGTKYLVMIRSRKTAAEKLFSTMSLPVDTADKATEIQNAISTKTLYSFEDIHVSDSLRWVPAQDPKTKNVLNGAYFKFASVGQSQTGKPIVSIQFDDQGKEIFCNLTEVHIGKQMAIFVGGNLMTAPVIRDKICGGSAQIDGSFDVKGARQLADDLNSGALPAPLLLSHEETIAPSLGQNALNKALTAGAVGIVLIYLFMMAIYGWKKANIALICLAIFLVLLLGISKLLGIVLSLSGIAAIVLSLGMAVDANVLIFERVREELKSGKTMLSAIDDGCERSWAPIKDGNMTTGIIGLLLFLIGVNVFKGFGTMMLINTILILGIVTPLTRQLLKLFYRSK